MQLTTASATGIARAVPAPLVQVARSAIEDLEPVIVVNRRVDDATTLLAGAADEPFPTLHGDPRIDPVVLARRVVRGINERVRGTYGTGDDAGRTVYGSVRFVPQADARAGAAAVVAALREQGDVGVRAYGPVSFIADPDSIRERTTFAADDSGATLAPVRERDELATVVAERLVRSDGRSAPSVDELLALPHAAARDAVRGWLLSDALAHHDGYVEAQVRRLAPEDLLAVVVDRRPDDAVGRRLSIDPGSVPRVQDARELARAARRLDLPMRVRTRD